MRDQLLFMIAKNLKLVQLMLRVHKYELAEVELAKTIKTLDELNNRLDKVKGVPDV